MGERGDIGWKKRENNVLLVMLWNQGMSFQSRPGSMKELMARAAPCERSTLSCCLLPVTSAGSSASNFCRMSYMWFLSASRTFGGSCWAATYLFAATELGRVDGDEEGLDAALLCVLDELLGDLAVLVHVPTAAVRLRSRLARICLQTPYSWRNCTWSGFAASTISSNEHEANVGICEWHVYS